MDDRARERCKRILRDIETTLVHVRHGLEQEGLRGAPMALGEALDSLRHVQERLRAGPGQDTGAATPAPPNAPSSYPQSDQQPTHQNDQQNDQQNEA